MHSVGVSWLIKTMRRPSYAVALNQQCLNTGFYPNILRVDHPPAVFKEVLGGAMEADGNPARLKFFDRSKGARTSVLRGGLVDFQGQLLLYSMLLLCMLTDMRCAQQHCLGDEPGRSCVLGNHSSNI